MKVQQTKTFHRKKNHNTTRKYPPLNRDTANIDDHRKNSRSAVLTVILSAVITQFLLCMYNCKCINCVKLWMLKVFLITSIYAFYFFLITKKRKVINKKLWRIWPDLNPQSITCKANPVPLSHWSRWKTSSKNPIYYCPCLCLKPDE